MVPSAAPFPWGQFHNTDTLHPPSPRLLHPPQPTMAARSARSALARLTGSAAAAARAPSGSCIVRPLSSSAPGASALSQAALRTSPLARVSRDASRLLVGGEQRRHASASSSSEGGTMVSWQIGDRAGMGGGDVGLCR